MNYAICRCKWQKMKLSNLTPQRLNWIEMTTTWKIEDLNNWTLYISRYMCDAILFPVLWQGLWQKIISNRHFKYWCHWLLKLQDVIKRDVTCLSCRLSHEQRQLAQGWIRPDTRSSCQFDWSTLRCIPPKQDTHYALHILLAKLAAKRDRCCISTNFVLALH